MDRAKRSPQGHGRVWKRPWSRRPAVPARVAALQKEIKALEVEDRIDAGPARTAKPRPTHIQKRGDFLDLGDAGRSPARLPRCTRST